MKKFLKKQCLGYILGAVLLGTGSAVFGAQAPSVTATTKEITKESLSMAISVTALPTGTKAVEVGMISDDLSALKELKWSGSLSQGEYNAHLIPTSASEKTLKFLLIAPKGEVLVGDQGALELGTFTFESQIQGKMDFKEGSVYVKVIGEDYEAMTYPSVELGHHHTALESGNEEGSGNEDGGETGNGNGNGSGNTGGSGSTGGNDQTDTSHTIEKPNKPEPMIPLESAMKQFTDIQGHWAEQVISHMAGKGIIEGYKDGTFKPAQQITRGEFATVLARAF
ncbi:MAG: S-layer homology domain-containing protein, partial [Cellulosilyticaceae bacterium]